jgi:hypothetical protein
MPRNFAELVAAGLQSERFSLLDLGCSGGIDARWRVFGQRLRALAIDASEAACTRLRTSEANPDVEYLAAFVAGSADAKIDPTRSQASPLILRIRDRLSFMRSLQIRDTKLAAAGVEDQLRHNVWEKTALANAAQPVVAPELLAKHRWDDLDYLKIDIDGGDFEVLKSFAGKFGGLRTLGVQLEVNFVGTDSDTDHTFHNTDRFMRRQGFELFRLDVRTYSSRALPARYVWPTPAETVSGRPFQGEAYYARDIDAPGLSSEKLAKLATILSLWGVADVAAELLVKRRAELAALFDVDKGLNLLAAEVQRGRVRKLGYRSYLRSFEDDTASFYRKVGPIGLVERLAAAWAAFRRPR